MSNYTVSEMNQEEELEKKCCVVCRSEQLYPEVQLDCDEEVYLINTTDLCQDCRRYFLSPVGTEDCRRYWTAKRINSNLSK